jgi:arylsulfatase A-like enzyme
MRWFPTRRFWTGPWPWLIAAALVAAVFVGRTVTSPKPLLDPRPIGGADEIRALSQRKDVNVLFILIDTLRADRLRTYGHTRATSPVFDVLASQGVRFAHQMSASSWTKCSMASLWTGLHPARGGVTRFDEVLVPAAKLPAELFREAGFRTAGIWRNGWVEGYFGFDQGFEVYTRPGTKPVPDELRQQNPTVEFGGTDYDLIDATSEFLRVYGRERWFVYLHLMDVHEYTYDEQSAQFGTSHYDIYDNAILHVNRVLDKLLGKLLERGQLEKTLIVIASDHGEAFGERGNEGHARNVYPEVVEVPLLINFPFRLARPAVIEQRTANVDIWPTVLDLLGLPPLEHADGRSRVPEILAAVEGHSTKSDDGIAIAHIDRSWGQRVETSMPNVAVSEGPYRYVVFRDAKGEIEKEELFDLRSDPQAVENQLDADREVAARLRGIADDYLKSKPPWQDSSPRLELDEMQLNQLRALGYKLP